MVSLRFYRHGKSRNRPSGSQFAAGSDAWLAGFWGWDDRTAIAFNRHWIGQTGKTDDITRDKIFANGNHSIDAWLR